MRYYLLIISTFFCLCNSSVDIINNFPKIRQPYLIKGFLYDILITLLKKCDLNMRKIIIVDGFYYLESSLAIADIQPQTSVTVLRHAGAWRSKSQYRFDDIEIDAVILVIDMMHNPWPDLLRVFLRWRFKRNSMILIIPKQMEFCSSYKQIFLLIMRFYFTAAYYICVKNGRYPVVYTQDPYGDTQPRHWIKVNQNIMYGRTWTYYARTFDEDLTELCPEFNFKRTDLINHTVIVGISLLSDTLGRRERLFDEQIEPLLPLSLQYEISIFKRLLKLRFNYVLLDSSGNKIWYYQRAYDLTSIDTFLLTKFILNPFIWWHHFHPTEYQPYAILSHNQGFMTPLEKIAKFYGIWTLSSLSVMLGITFIVIWFSTRNFYLASFDVVRLLINAEIIVPITTAARKIFFGMVFLYFLIIHATFSGHLAEFLTSVERRPNIDTLEDLRSPIIEKIYHFGYIYSQDDQDIRRKSESIEDSLRCADEINNTKFACIAPLTVLEMTRINAKDVNDSLHISRERIGLSLITYLYRHGFPLAEKINWVFIYMFDTNIVHEDVKSNREILTRLDNKHRALRTIDYRVVMLGDISFAFMFLIVGYGVGIICFVCEIVFKRIFCRERNQHRQRDRNILSMMWFWV